MCGRGRSGCACMRCRAKLRPHDLAADQQPLAHQVMLGGAQRLAAAFRMARVEDHVGEAVLIAHAALDRGS